MRIILTCFDGFSEILDDVSSFEIDDEIDEDYEDLYDQLEN